MKYNLLDHKRMWVEKLEEDLEQLELLGHNKTSTVYKEGLKRTKKAQKELATLESSVQKKEVDLTHTYLQEQKMADKRKEKIQKLLALAADVNDEESMSALAKAQQLMMDYDLTEDEIFNYHEQQRIEAVETHVIYRGRPQKWLYRLFRN